VAAFVNGVKTNDEVTKAVIDNKVIIFFMIKFSKLITNIRRPLSSCFWQFP